MLLSKSWLRDFVDIDIPERDYSERMSLSGSKVEGWQNPKDAIMNVVVGQVVSVEPHPNADRLRMCQIDTGSQNRITVLTAATNVTAGCLVPVALDGAVLPGGKTIHSGEMRGVMSEGMLCSFKELGLTHNDVPYADEDGILLIDTDDSPCAPGDDICGVLGLDDTVFEFEITPNRPDCLSVRGLARETAATFDKQLTLSEPKVKGGGGDVGDFLSLQIDAPELCPRYSARVVKDVKIGQSPLWIRARLRAAGVRPINNIVDVTNYVMLEYGQPMHAFDHACLDGGKIVVRTACEGEVLYTLDGQERKLTTNMLMIADANKPVCVAGVMGGANSEITGKTKMIVLESANFNGPSVRKTALQLAMRTDASSRFEKGLDVENTIPALERACELIELLGIGVVLDGVLDAAATVYEPRAIPLECGKINALLGTNIPQADMESYLKSLQFKVKDGMVEIPSFRADVGHMADLAEEVARMYGYNRIPSSLSSGGAAVGALTPRQKLKQRVQDICRASSFDEMLSYSFISPSDFDRIRLPERHSLRNCVKLLNPLGEDKSVMRTTMLPSLMNMLSGNAAVRNPEARLFELGLTFLPAEHEKLPKENLVIALGAYGAGFDFYAMKGVVEAIAAGFYIHDLSFKPQTDFPSFHPGRCAEVFCGDCRIGVMGELHPDAAYDIDERVYVAELSFDALWSVMGGQPRYQPLPRFPAIRRDIALLCGREVMSSTLSDCVIEACDELLVSCELFDVYMGDRIPEDKKSIAYKLVFRAPDRTLTDAEADERVKRAVEALESKHNAVLR